MKKLLPLLVAAALLPCAAAAADRPASALSGAVARDYDAHLAPLLDYFHRNPELSFLEVKTAARMAQELRAAGFEVTEKVGGTGVVGILKNGPGPLVMMRADMDGLPMLEKSGLPNASTVTQKDTEGNLVPVAHACGHDIHMTSLVGTARRMALDRASWSGTLMLVGQPAEERIGGAIAMMKDGLYKRFGKPDFALGFHVKADMPVGKVHASEVSPYSGADTVEIAIKGVGAHGAQPHRGKDPIVLGAMIVMGLQTVVSRELGPREPGLITVGSFHGGTKANIIGDNARLQLTVRYENPKTRELLLNGIRRMAENTARAVGMADNELPEVKLVDTPAPPVMNTVELVRRLRAAWTGKLGAHAIGEEEFREGMGSEDFPQFVTDPYIPSVYFTVGGTAVADIAAAKAGKLRLPSHHSPLFKVEHGPAVRMGVESTVVALQELMPKR
ncbi:amidohydrolase [Massilia yuzhufengensis]|uniref:Hippurate hydrolase n=1 Tax=Massilia yuzhufengensis TaxID=1164594 RepID=A0A1I1S3P2_9BURK|nr:amidohydrolase [Massilia yuzhufengensis]SFD41121.1 hippurate hydrolase [Massilia yuzhufengensis]